jgi:hypothetical protein
VIWVWRTLAALWTFASIAVLIWGRETAKVGIVAFHDMIVKAWEDAERPPRERR